MSSSRSMCLILEIVPLSMDVATDTDAETARVRASGTETEGVEGLAMAGLAAEVTVSAVSTSVKDGAGVTEATEMEDLSNRTGG